MRHRVAGVDQRLLPLLARQVAQPGHVGPDRRPDRLRLGGQFDRGRPAHAPADQAGNLDRRLLDVQHRSDRRGPPQVQVSVVLPGEPDPAVYLDVEVSVADRGRNGQHSRDGRGVAELVAADLGPSGIPGGGRRQLGRYQHVRAMMLDRLESRDRPAELLANLRVLGRLLRGLSRDADCLRGEHGPGHVGQEPARARQHRRRRRVEPDPGRTPALVQIGGYLGLHAAGRLLNYQYVVTGRDQQHVRQMTAEHDAYLPGRGAASAGHLAAQCGRADHAAVSQPWQQPLLQLIGSGSGQHRAGDHGRDERPRREVPAHLLGYDQRFGQPEARATKFF